MARISLPNRRRNLSGGREFERLHHTGVAAAGSRDGIHSTRTVVHVVR